MPEQDLPAPLVPAVVNLQDFSFMPLDVARLRDSDLATNETPEACWAAVLLWCASWHQVPAASIPDDDKWIARAAGYVSRGRIDPQWDEIRTGALHGWVKCSDGRLYHPVVAEKARDAWRSKMEQRWKTECARIKKHNQRHGLSLDTPDFDEWVSQGCPQGQSLPVPRTTPPCPEDKKPCPEDNPPLSHENGDVSPGSPGEIDSKGQGQGQGYIPPPPLEDNLGGGQGRDGAGGGEDIRVDLAGATPTAAGLICRRLKAEGIQRVNPGHPLLAKLIAVGATADELAGYAEAAKGKGEPFTWLLTAAANTRKQAAEQAQGMRTGPLKPAAAGSAWEGAI